MHLRKLLILGASALFVANIASSPALASHTFLHKKETKAEETDTKSKKKSSTKLSAAEKKAKAKEDAKIAAAEKAKAKAEAKAKADKEKLAAAKLKAEKEKKLAKEKAAAEKKLAREKAAEERKMAQAKAADEKKKAAEEKRLAKEKAAEDVRVAKARAVEEKRLAKEAAEKAARDEELRQLAALDVYKSGNNGELRSENSEAAAKPTGLFGGLFGGSAKKISMLPETRALDAALAQKDAKRKFKVKDEFQPEVVEFSGYERGTIVINTGERKLYLVESSGRARKYSIAVGKDGLQYKGTVTVGDKQEWPRWIPTKDMQKRDPKKYGQYADGMPGGPENPLGARAIYLYEGKKDTHLRIHGTNAPETIGTSSSNGCFRMINDHVKDLYGRVRMGTKVVVL